MTLVLVIAAAVPPITVEVAQAQEAQGEQTVKCPHPKSWTPSAEDLSRILAEHRKWVKGWEDNGSSMQWGLDHPEGRANLCNAFLSKPNLFGENLFMAYLSGAYLIEADLRGANLSAATLIGATLIEAKLDNANLYVADLSKANLGEAKLNNAILIGTILTETSLARIIHQRSG